MPMSNIVPSGEARLVERAKMFGQPINGALELLPLCNLNCKMCYVRLSRGEMEILGRLRTGAEWLDLGRQMAQAGTLFLQLTGGEPLLHPDFKEIYTGLQRLGMILTVNTNGTLIDKDWVDFFAAHRPRRLNITLYGADEETYRRQCGSGEAFHRVVKAVRMLRERGVDVKLNGSMTPQIREDLPRMAALARSLDVPIHVDPYMMPAARERSRAFDQQSRLSPEDAAAVAVDFQRITRPPEVFREEAARCLAAVDAFEPGQEAPAVPGCMAGRCGFTVSWLGRLQPCEVLTEPGIDVFEMGFQVAWDRLREDYARLRYCSACTVCRLRPLCSPCPAACLLETGDHLGRPDYLCRYAQAYEAVLRQLLEDGNEG